MPEIVNELETKLEVERLNDLAFGLDQMQSRLQGIGESKSEASKRYELLY